DPFIRLTVIIVKGPDDDIVIAIPIHIPGGIHVVAEVCAVLIALCRPSGGRTQAGGRAMIQIGSPFIILTVVIGVGADEDIRVTIAIHIASGSGRGAIIGIGLITFRDPV